MLNQQYNLNKFRQIKKICVWVLNLKNSVKLFLTFSKIGKNRYSLNFFGADVT